MFRWLFEIDVKNDFFWKKSIFPQMVFMDK